MWSASATDWTHHIELVRSRSIIVCVMSDGDFSAALTDPNAAAAQQAVLQQQLSLLTYSPYGDSPLFRNQLSDPKKKEEVIPFFNIIFNGRGSTFPCPVNKLFSVLMMTFVFLQRLKPTNPTAQKALTTPTHYKLTPRPATRVRPKALSSSGASKSQLFDVLDDDEPSLTNGAFKPRWLFDR